MKHYEEDTIELFVLDSDKIAGEREEIEAHLSVCYSCREIANELRQFHTAVGSLRPLLQDGSGPLAASSLSLTPQYSRQDTVANNGLSTLSRSAQFMTFVRSRPAVVALSGLTFVVLAIALLFFPRGKTNTNPAYFHITQLQGGMVVYNSDNVELWRIPLKTPAEYEATNYLGQSQYSRLISLGGNARTGVVTILPQPWEGSFLRTLRIFDGSKSIVSQRMLEDMNVKFKGTAYASMFVYEGLLTVKGLTDAGTEVFCWGSNGRSPYFLAGFDLAGKMIGRFWHFGGPQSIDAVNSEQEGKQDILYCGINQVTELETLEYPVVLLLDPAKIEGDRESTATRGFGFDPSRAEKLYLRLPESELFQALNARPRVLFHHQDSNGDIFIIERPAGGPTDIFFEYMFSRDLHVLDVKYSSPALAFTKEMQVKGKIKGTLDRAYLNRLGESIRYWDGTKWSKSWQKVGSPLVQK